MSDPNPDRFNQILNRIMAKLDEMDQRLSQIEDEIASITHPSVNGVGPMNHGN